MVEVSSTDWDESISRVSRTSKLWVNDDWHVQATWLGESAEYVRVRIELREGPAMMFRLLRNEE